MLAKLRVLLIAVLALVAVPETIFADDSAKVTSLEALLKQYMDENAELKRAIAEQGANDASTAVDVVVGEATPSPDGADATERLELYPSEIICERAQLNDNEYGLVVKMDAKKYADEAERRGLNCLVDKAKSCKDDLENCRKETLCKFVNAWYPGADKIYIDAAQARGLDCGVEMAVVKPEPVISCEEDPRNCDADELCKKASYGSSLKVWYVFSEQVYVDAAQARGLDCGVGKAVDKPEPVKTCEDDPKNCEADELCKQATYGSSRKFWYGFSEQVYVDAAQARGLDCGVMTNDKGDAENQQAAAAGQAAEEKRLADEKQKKADADAKAAEQKRLAEEEKKKEAEKKNPSNSDYYTCTKDHETLATLAEKYFSRQDIDRSFWKQCTVHVGLTILEFTDDYAVAYKSSSMFTGFTYGTTNSIYSGGPVVCMDADLGTKKRGFGWDCTAS